MLGAPPPLISSASVFHRYPSCCSPVFLIPAAHHQRDRVIRQRPLQRLRLVPRRAHPDVALLVGDQDHRHRLRVDRLDDRVRRRRQKAVDVVRPRDRLRLGARSPLNSAQRPATPLRFTSTTNPSGMSGKLLGPRDRFGCRLDKARRLRRRCKRDHQGTDGPGGSHKPIARRRKSGSTP